MSIQLGVNSNYYSSKLNQNTSPSKILARVDKVILGPTEANGQPDKDFQANGGWASVGSIRFTVMYGGEVVDNVTSTIARPYYPNITQYPLRGEIVELTYGPSTRLNESGLEKDIYYQNPINLWNNVHHNAFPNFLSLSSFNNNLATPYIDASRGVTATSATSSQVYPLGATFVEKSNIKNLQPFEGDIIYQSRWGQSIRFGSTVRNSATKNPWSSTGKNGDPIVIIRNGQAADRSADPWTTNIEDINNDAASIYMCSGQAIIIQDLSNFKLDSFTIDSKLTENSVQTTKKQPLSADATSPASQSQFELQYAQASTQVTVPSTIPQTNVTVAYAVTGSPLQSTAANVNITTTTTLPTGQVTSSVITAPYNRFGVGTLGTATFNALARRSPAPTIATIPTGSRPITATGQQTETTEDLEVITAEESDLRFNFEIDNSGNPGALIQDDVPDTPSPTSPPLNVPDAKSPADKYYYTCALFNQGDPKWASNSSGRYTLKTAGCCYTSFAMMTTYYKRDNKYTPQWYWDNVKKSVVVYWAEMANAVNLRSSGAVKATTTREIDQRLEKGPVMFEWDNASKASRTAYAGLYTKRHHWMLIVGKGVDGTYTIFDPNGGRIRKNQTKEQIEAGLIRISYIV